MKRRLTEEERLRKYPLSKEQRLGLAVLTLSSKCGIEGERCLQAIFQRHGVACATELDKSQDAAVLAEVESEIVRLGATLPPEMQAEIARLRKYFGW